MGGCQAQKYWKHCSSGSGSRAASRPGGMTPLHFISSHLGFSRLVPRPAVPCSAGKGPAVRPVNASALPKVPSGPQLSGKRSHCQATPLPCPAVTCASLEVGIGMDSDCLVARHRREEPENRRCAHIRTRTRAHPSDGPVWPPCLSALTSDWRRF